MEILEPEEWGPMKCGGVISDNTTDEDMRARGFTEVAIEEVRCFERFLQARGNLEFHGTFQEWRAEDRAPTQEDKNDG